MSQTDRNIQYRNILMNPHIGGNYDAKNESQNIHDQMYVLKGQDKLIPPKNRQFNPESIIESNLGSTLDRSLNNSVINSDINNGRMNTYNQYNQSDQNINLRKQDVYLRHDKDRYEPYDGFLYNKGLMNDGYQKRRYKSYFLDVNSAFREKNPSLITGEAILLDRDPIGVGLTQISNVVFISQPNHTFQVNDTIALYGATGRLSILRTYINSTTPTFEIPVGCNFMKVFYVHNIPNTYTSDTINVTFSGIQGDNGSTSNSFLGNIPVNTINTSHRFYTTVSQDDITCPMGSFPLGYFTPSTSYFFIILPYTLTTPYTLRDYNFKLSFDSIFGIPINLLNAYYPITANNINGYHIIQSTTADGYYITVQGNAAGAGTGGGACVYVSLINSINTGYPDPNSYRIDLQSVLNNIVSVRLISSEIPNTEKAIRDYPEERANNVIYWNDIDDGDYLYSITVPPGNYTPDELAKTLEKLFLETPRLNASASTYTNGHYMQVDIDINTDIVTFKSYKEYILAEPLISLDPTIGVNTDPNVTYQYTIEHNNHGMTKPGALILIQNALASDGVPASIINAEFTVSEIIDDNHYKINLPRFNALADRTQTKGGNNVTIYIPDTFRLRFDQPGTMGTVLGFRNAGAETSVSNYSTVIKNSDPYQYSVAKNSAGQPIKITNNSLQMSGDNYIIMVIDQIKTYRTLGPIKNAFAKILLCDSPGKILYNTYVPIIYYFDDPLNELFELNISFYSYDGYLYNFNGVDHSFTLEFVTVNDIPEGTGINSNTGKNYNLNVQAL